MPQIILDFSAIREAQASLASLADAAREEAQRHQRLAGQVERALSDTAGAVLHAVASGAIFDAWEHWETLGFGGVVWEIRASHDAATALRSRLGSAISALCDSHGAKVGAALAADARAALEVAGSPLGQITSLLDAFVPFNLISFLRAPWTAADPFNATRASFDATVIEIAAYSGLLGQVIESASVLILFLETAPELTDGILMSDALTNATRALSVGGGAMAQVTTMSVTQWESGFDYGYQRGDYPIRIGETTGPDGQRQIVIQLLGTEVGRTTQGNNLLNAIGVGMEGLHSDPYYQDIQAAIQQYIKTHPGLSLGTPIVIQGHSLGGMEAQELAASQQFNVVGVEAYGSPNLGLSHGGARVYDLYANHYDAVPDLSAYEGAAAVNAFGASTLDLLTTGKWTYSQHFDAYSGLTFVPGGKPGLSNLLANHFDYNAHGCVAAATPFPVTSVTNVQYYSAPAQ